MDFCGQVFAGQGPKEGPREEAQEAAEEGQALPCDA